MDKKAAAFGQYNEAAVLQMLIETLPQMAAAIAGPLGSIDKLTVISSDGTAELPRQVTSNLLQTIEMLKNTTGVDIDGLVKGYVSRGQAGPVAPAAPAAAVETVVEPPVDGLN